MYFIEYIRDILYILYIIHIYVWVHIIYYKLYLCHTANYIWAVRFLGSASFDSPSSKNILCKSHDKTNKESKNKKNKASGHKFRIEFVGPVPLFR